MVKLHGSQACLFACLPVCFPALPSYPPTPPLSFSLPGQPQADGLALFELDSAQGFFSVKREFFISTVAHMLALGGLGLGLCKAH